MSVKILKRGGSELWDCLAASLLTETLESLNLYYNRKVILEK